MRKTKKNPANVSKRLGQALVFLEQMIDEGRNGYWLAQGCINVMQKLISFVYCYGFFMIGHEQQDVAMVGGGGMTEISHAKCENAYQSLVKAEMKSSCSVGLISSRDSDG